MAGCSKIKLIEPFEKKRRQNCLRQRAWRQRQRTIRNAKIRATNHDNPWRGYGLLMVADRYDSETVIDSSVATIPLSSMGEGRTSLRNSTPVEVRKKASNIRKLIPPLLPYASSSTIGHPSPLPTSFPLSADHLLITLVQYNVVRALLFNLSILSMMDHVPLGCGASLKIPRFAVVAPERIPSDLQPSLLQNSTPHPFWIDSIPLPRFRDNLILMSGTYDSADLFYDLVQGIYEGFDDAERRGYLVWGDSWSARGWEVSEGFMAKWGFLLAGCADVIDSTNRWREARGEDRMIVDKSNSEHRLHDSGIDMTANRADLY